MQLETRIILNITPLSSTPREGEENQLGFALHQAHHPEGRTVVTGGDRRCKEVRTVIIRYVQLMD
jgi:hypothetical protein